MLVFRFQSEIPPIMPIRLKVEINCREHFNVLGLTQHDFSVNNQWFSGNCKITTYHLDELLGTKTRALYQRRIHTHESVVPCGTQGSIHHAFSVDCIYG